MSSWRTFVVEDEKITQEHICAIIEEDSELSLVGTSENVKHAIEAIPMLDPELLLLDIQIADGDSFEILSALEQTPEIIFITAFDKFAIRAFEENAIDYVLKPFNKMRLNMALAKAKDRLRSQDAETSLANFQALMHSLMSEKEKVVASTQIPIKVAGKTVLRDAKEIRWIEASKNQAVLHFGQDAFPIRETLTAFENKFSTLNFARIHRSTIVNIDYVEEIQSWFHGDYVLILKDGTSLKMSRRYKSNFEERISGKL